MASLKIPRTEVITLGKPLHLTFEDIVSEMVIVLISQDLALVDLEIVPLSPIIDNYYKTKMAPLSRKRKQVKEICLTNPL